MNLSLHGRRALVCGASGGIGAAAALELAMLGASVTALARRPDRLRTVVGELHAAGAPEAHALVADLDDRAALDLAVHADLDRYGPIHILINNTGGPPPGPLVDASASTFLQAFGRHILSAHALVQRVLPGMRASSYGRILNILSTSVREPIPNLGVSNTIRGAMASWAKTLANELPPGITVNNVLPGYTDTERLGTLAEAAAVRTGQSLEGVREAWAAASPEGRLGKPEELGAVIAFLASPAASFVRGVSLAVDGGRIRSL